ncbi:hypothetical protein BC833DRAFT_590694 [Globomyces pollinis-pini]|nr:hypothetical protein BC833DRAFT_590694 [Globomyces pollinis-pini]
MTDRIRLANDKIQGIPKDSTCYKILNAMLNGYNDTQFQGYGETRKIIVDDILNSKNLEELSQLYDDSFLVPMRARPSSATRRIQNQEDSNSDSSSFNSSAFMKMVRERDADKCVLTGDSDISTASVIRNLFEVAHFIPQSLLDNRKDSDVRKKAKRSIRDFIKRLCPWIPNNFFEQLDICENGILLNPIAHKYFDAFEWFVTTENGSDGNTIYRAMQVEENGLLKLKNTRREVSLDTGGFDLLSSYNQPLYIGNSHPQPGEIYVRLHELLARIFKMRGQADYYEIDSDDEYEPLDNSEIMEKMAS